METLHVILLKKTLKDFNHSKEDPSPKPKRKKRSESLQAIFRLPKSVLDKFRPHCDSSMMRRERSRVQQGEETIELGNIAQEYTHNLRRTILGQAKESLSANKNKSHLQHNNFLLEDPSRTLTNRQDYPSQYEKNLSTLKILQKAIIREDDLFEVHENLLELQANRLPIIRKRQSKRKKLLAAFEQKYHEFSPPRKEVPREKDFSLSKRDFIPIPSNKRAKEEKPDIRGWDTLDLLEA